MNTLNKSRYLELINKDKILKRGLYFENQTEYEELLSYGIILEEQIIYENRFDYLNLIKRYLNGKINCYAFQADFTNLSYAHSKIVDNIEKNLDQFSFLSFSSDSKRENFVSLISDDICALCEFLDDGLTEEGFDFRIRKIYSKVQKYAKSTSPIYNDNEVLRSTMLFFTVITAVAYCFLKSELFNFFWQ